MKRLLSSLMPGKVIQSRLHQRVFRQFAGKIGLVYFGYVDQRSDEHRPVRGLTMSSRHVDNHYCIGSFRGYDVTLVERTDTITFPGKATKHATWIIMTFNLHVVGDLPHVFVGLHSHSETFYAHLFTKFSELHKVPLGTLGVHDQAFTERYGIFTQPAKSLEVERLFDPSVTKVIADHFDSLTLEIVENQLYIYAQQQPTQTVLETMLTYGAWLAETIEARYPAI